MPPFFHRVKVNGRVCLDRIRLRVKNYFLNSLWQLIRAFAEPGVYFISINLGGASLHGIGLRVPLEKVQFALETLCRRGEVRSLGDLNALAYENGRKEQHCR